VILEYKWLNGREGWSAENWDIYSVLPAFTEKAVQYIHSKASQSNDQPFFLYLPLNSPHKPIAVNEQFIGKSDAGVYGDFVVETDSSIGQVMQAVREAGIDEETLIIFTSDNGPERIMYAIQDSLHCPVVGKNQTRLTIG